MIPVHACIQQVTCECRALRRKVGGTAKNYFKEWVDVRVRLWSILPSAHPAHGG